jgi:hypothetical protein
VEIDSIPKYGHFLNLAYEEKSEMELVALPSGLCMRHRSIRNTCSSLPALPIHKDQVILKRCTSTIEVLLLDKGWPGCFSMESQFGYLTACPASLSLPPNHQLQRYLKIVLFSERN